ncbi:hypothetical protein [Calothrix sp. PCC 7507]|uniref:hypothetical protein n=1 Tax=Calothrix sp. PCC 7507 TaxID=99598 RepID=UPI00029F2F64|nr:hypothetical protein [Calothrix sp. PCC 7507]AFY30792.1 hypothetical protein Cal7507_0293 [Calothrix sp. PCC 7507]
MLSEYSRFEEVQIVTSEVLFSSEATLFELSQVRQAYSLGISFTTLPVKAVG